MPIYNITNKLTNETKEIFLSFSEYEKFDDKNWSLNLSTPSLVSSVRDIFAKQDNGFKELKDRIKKGSGRNNTIK